MKDFLIAALDVRQAEAEKIVRGLRRDVKIFKVGSRLFTEAGPASVGMVRRAGCRVFLDLKLHDIPATVAGACRNVVRLGVWGFTIHASGGFAMMKEAVLAVKDESRRLKIPRPLVFGVTVLTSFSKRDLKEAGCSRSVPGQVKHLARAAKAAGLDGVVASGHEIRPVRSACGKNFLIVVPGVRPAGPAGRRDDQNRVVTPGQAVRLGADYLVVGRPILEARDKRRAAREIQNEAVRA